MADDQVVTETVLPALAAPIQGQLAPTPYNFEFTGEDFLRLSVWNSSAGVRVAVHYRMLTRQHRSHASRYEISPTSDRAATVSEFPIGDGYLLNATVLRAAGFPLIGTTFCKLQVIRGRGASATVLGTIAQGYISVVDDLAWPGSPILTSLEGGGVIRSVGIGSPGAGVEPSITVPAGARWELLSLAATFDTSAAAATRQPVVVGFSFGIRAWASPHPRTVPASTFHRFLWTSQSPLEAVYTTPHQSAWLPPIAILQVGDTITMETLNLQAGDDWSTVNIRVREWIEVLL